VNKHLLVNLAILVASALLVSVVVNVVAVANVPERLTHCSLLNDGADQEGNHHETVSTLPVLPIANLLKTQPEFL